MSFSVAKFGGTSVADYSAMQACADILAQDPTSQVVVVSASAGVTNLLVALAEGCDEQKRTRLMAEIQGIQARILCQFHPPLSLEHQVHRILAQIQHLAKIASKSPSLKLRDAILSQGEILSSLIFTALLQQRGMPAKWIDIREIVQTDSHFGQAKVQDIPTLKQAQRHLLPLIQQGELIVTQGFIGQNEQGDTTTLGRGGSDYSAALLAEVLGAKNILIWTDVAGIYTTDPRCVPHAYPIKQMSFNEAGELANFGAKVLHPSTILPALRANLPVFVGSSKAPQAGGTWVTQHISQQARPRAIAIRQDQTLLSVMNPHPTIKDLPDNIIRILNKYPITADILQQNGCASHIAVDKLNANLCRQEQDRLFHALLTELSQLTPLKVRTGLSLIALVGHCLPSHSIFEQIKPILQDFHIYALGCGENYCCLLTENQHASLMVQALHKTLFEN